MLGPPPPFPVGGGGPWIGMGNQNQSSEVAVLLQPRLDDDAPSPLPVLLLVGTTPRGNSCFAFKIKKRGRVFISQELWRALHATAR